MKSNQSLAPNSFGDEARRLGEIQSDLIRIVGAFGMSRSLLQRRGPWDEASRDARDYGPYRPYTKERDMIIDVVKAVALRGSAEKKAAVRSAVRAYFDTRCEDALSALGEDSAEDVVRLTLETTREVSEASQAATVALTSASPENFATAAREESEAIGVLERLRASCLAKARARFTTPRTSKLFQVAR